MEECEEAHFMRTAFRVRETESVRFAGEVTANIVTATNVVNMILARTVETWGCSLSGMVTAMRCFTKTPETAVAAALLEYRASNMRDA